MTHIMETIKQAKEYLYRAKQKITKIGKLTSN